MNVINWESKRNNFLIWMRLCCANPELYICCHGTESVYCKGIVLDLCANCTMIIVLTCSLEMHCGPGPTMQNVLHCVL